MRIKEKYAALTMATVISIASPGFVRGQAAAQANPIPATSGKTASDLLHGPITDDEFKLTLDADAAAKVDAAIGRLSSPEYKKREEATNSLIEVGAPAFARLRAAYEQIDDAEVRQRIERIIRTAYLNYYVLDQFGYLGITMQAQAAQQFQRPIPQGVSGIKVGNVMPNSGASRAGLRVEDLIIAIDGVLLADSGLNEVGKFSEQIRARKPGTKMKMTVLRGGKQVDLEPILGRAPTETARSDRGLNITVTSELARLAEERFEVWWPKYFNPQVAPNSPKAASEEMPQETPPPHAPPE